MPWSLEILHSLFIHFPIALFSTGFACDLIAFIFRKDSAENAGWWCLFFVLFGRMLIRSSPQMFYSLPLMI